MRLLVCIAFAWAMLLSNTSFGEVKSPELDEKIKPHIHEEQKKVFYRPSEVLYMAYFSNPRLKSKGFERDGAYQNKKAVSFLSDPVVGYSVLNRNMETKYITIGQRIDFPTKYYYKGKSAEYFAKSKGVEYDMERLQLRKRVLTMYFDLYAAVKIRELTNANIETVKEVARISEKKYASGRGSQSESMRAHLELTNLELSLFKLDEQINTLQRRLRAELDATDMGDLTFTNIELARPLFDESKTLSINSLSVQSADYLYKQAQMNKKIAQWSLAPNFDIRYQKAISGEPNDSDILSVGITVPLWFWRNKAEIGTKSLNEQAKLQMLRAEKLKADSEAKNYKDKVDVSLKTLVVYETSLIPQALGALNSTKAAYRANRAGFLDLLESERLFYKIKENYYKTLSSYIDDITGYEVVLGRELLTLN